jgi:tetratricopeptide (TPR) repeat protein
MNESPESVGPSANLTQKLEDLYERFEQAWRAGRRPAIADYLPPEGSGRRRALAELAAIDLECRLKVGETARVETYLESFPELAAHPTAVLDLIGAEYRLRRRREGEVRAEEYLERFPAYRAGLSPRLPGAPSGVTPEVPGYEIVRELGRGGMGVVYEARQLALDRPVALKMLRDGALAEAEELARFRREAETVARLRHPNVVQVYEVREGPGHPYFTMEFVEGGTLARRLGGKPLPPAEAARVVEVLARAVHAVHGCGVVHRDLKPGNVLLTADGTPKVVDFGLARRLEGDGHPTSVGRVLGTPPYMAPEQARGDTRAVGPATDVYALGAILYETLSGRPPFQGATGWDTIAQVLSTEPVPPRRLQPRVPADLETICLKCIAKDPARRYPTAEALAEDLSRFLKGEPIRARPSGPAERAWKWARRRPAVASLLGVLAVVILGSLAGLTALWLRARRERDRAEARFQMALEVVAKLKDVSESPELKARGLEDWRRQLLESATGFYDRFSRDVAGDPALRGEHARASVKVGDLLSDLGRTDDAEAAYRRALATFEDLAAGRRAAADYRRDLAECRQSLGSLYRQTGRTDLAEESFQKALVFRQGLVEDHPEDAQLLEGLALAWNDLGLLYHDTGRDEKARESWEKARDLLRDLSERQPDEPEHRRKLAAALNNLGSLYYQARQLDLCEKAYDEELTICRQLATAQPQAPESQRDLADAHNNLALVYTATGRPDQAEQAFAEAVRLQKQLVQTHPDVPEYQQLLARSYNNVGDLCTQVERYPRAEEAFGKALVVTRRLTATHPDVPEYLRDVALGEYNLGEVFRYTGRIEQAEASYRQAQEHLEALVKRTPEGLDNIAYLASALVGRGEAARAAGKHAAALEWYGRAIDLAEGVRRKDAVNAPAAEALLAARSGQAAALARLGRRAEAAQALRQVEDLCRENSPPELHLYRAQVWAWTGDPAKAAAEAAEAARDKATLGRTLYEIARVYAVCAMHSESGPTADHYVGQAVPVLLRARSAGYFQAPAVAARLRTDPDFAPLMARPGFQKILRELPGPPTGGEKPGR